MKLTLFIAGVLLMVTWIFGFFIYSAGALIHVFIILAVLSFMQGIIMAPGPQPEKPPVA